MGIAIHPGFAFTNKATRRYPTHLHFALTDAESDPDRRFLMANFTTDPKTGCPSMVIQPTEHAAWLRQPSMIAFALVAVPDKAGIEAALLGQAIFLETELSAALVAKIQLGLLASPQTELRYKDFLRRRMA